MPRAQCGCKNLLQRLLCVGAAHAVSGCGVPVRFGCHRSPLPLPLLTLLLLRQPQLPTLLL